jgi:lipid-binding SYLF domain-containing protein
MCSRGSRAKGVYGGINLDGTVVTASDDWNEAYFKSRVLPPDILLRGDLTNPQAAPLLNAVARAASGGGK